MGGGGRRIELDSVEHLMQAKASFGSPFVFLDHRTDRIDKAAQQRSHVVWRDPSGACRLVDDQSQIAQFGHQLRALVLDPREAGYCHGLAVRFDDKRLASSGAPG